MLHSFYCWGQAGVVLISTLFFFMAGIDNWKILAIVWAILPVCNAIVFAKVPIAPLIKEGDSGLKIKELFRLKVFWILCIMMLCAGASEQAVSQWASAFAESGLGVSKTVGDLAGPCFFAALMGLSRVIYAKFGDRLNLLNAQLLSGVLCVGGYLLAALSTVPLAALLGCGLCGFSVGILWPGTFSVAARHLPAGGTAMFALLALAGDLGCAGGLTLAGLVSSACGGSLRAGILAALIFPALMLVCLLGMRKTQ